MTDWERVEKLRSKGLSWDEIAEDDRVGFVPPAGSGKPGLALKSLYFQRRSRRQKQGKGSASDGSGRRDGESKKEMDKPALLAFLGFTLTLAAAIPIAVSFGVSLVTIFVSLLDLLVVAGVGLAMLALAFIFGTGKALRGWKRGLISGAIVGVVLVAALASSAVFAGCPTLTASTSSEPTTASGDSSWDYAANPLWTKGGLPVLFFLGSAACPYCSASSWAIYGALRNFSSSVSGEFWATSNPDDVYPSTPEVDLSSSSASGPYVTWDQHEGSYTLAIEVPTPGCPENAYVNAYDSQGSIPFLVVGGQFVHAATLVDPADLQENSVALPPQTISEDIQAGESGSSNSVWVAISTAQYWIEAYLEMCDKEAGITPPTAVSSNAQVSSDLAAIVT